MMSAGFRSLLDSFQARSADWVFTLSAHEWRTSPASIFYDVVCVCVVILSLCPDGFPVSLSSHFVCSY